MSLSGSLPTSSRAADGLNWARSQRFGLAIQSLLAHLAAIRGRLLGSLDIAEEDVMVACCRASLGVRVCPEK
jgi:hypothetical protein